MSFRTECLSPAFEAQGEHSFAVWTYSSPDRLGEVAGAGYFARAVRILRPGDLIYVGLSSPPRGQPYDSPVREVRRAILMVATLGGQDLVTTRLVQDMGGPLDGDAPIREPEPRRFDAARVEAAASPPSANTNSSAEQAPRPEASAARFGRFEAGRE